MVKNSVGVRRKGEFRSLLYPAFRAAGCSAFFQEKKNHFYYVLSLLNSKKSNKKELLPSILPYQNPQGKMKKKREEGKEGNSTGKETDKLLCLN